MAFAQVPYSDTPPAPSGAIDVDGSGAQQFRVQANPNDFGGQIAQSVEKVGGQTQELGQQAISVATEFARQTTEAKADDTLANQFTPAAAKLRQQYDLLSPQGKLNGGYQQYLGSLQDLRTSTLGNATSPYEKEVMQNFIQRHVTSEVFDVNKETVAAQKQFVAQSTGDLLLSQKNSAINNWNNPDIANVAQQTIDGKVTISGLDNGQTPDQIDQTKRSMQGDIAVGQIAKAADAGDHDAATNIYYNNKDSIPGPQRIAAAQDIHNVNMLQFGRQAGSSLIAGQPIPPNGGQAALDIKASIADKAQQSNFDPNVALTVARIESNYGQNVGARGTIGQDNLGGTKDEQIAHLIQNLQQAKNTADQVVGGNSTPDQQYLIYQQGIGGGAALLRASMNDPNKKAVDVVSQFYKDPKTALSAIQKNGGNSTMTAKQFCDYISQKYNTNARFAQCDIPQQQPNTEGNVAQGQENFQDNEFRNVIDQQVSLGDALKNAHLATDVPPMQTAANPSEQLKNFDLSYIPAIQQANQIPNLEERANVVKYLNDKRQGFVEADGAYKQSWQIQAEKLAANPQFTSIDQIPPSWKKDLPGDTLHYLETRAVYNSEYGSTGAAKDNRTYGSEFTDLFHNIHSPDGTPDKITDITQLQAKVGNGLTISGYDKLSSEMSSKKSPEGEAEGDMKKQFFEMAKSQISGKDPNLGITDPKGQEQYLKFMTRALADYDKGKSEGKTPYQLFSPDSKDYIGTSIPLFKRPTSQWINDMIKDNPDLFTPAPVKKSWLESTPDELSGKLTPDIKDINSPDQLKQAYQQAQKNRDSVKMLQYLQEAIKRGYIQSPSTAPAVPTGE